MAQASSSSSTKRSSRKGGRRAAVKRKSKRKPSRETRSDKVPGRTSSWDDYPWTVILGDTGYGDAGAVTMPAVWACIKAIAEDIGKLPIRAKRNDDRETPWLRNG